MRLFSRHLLHALLLAVVVSSLLPAPAHAAGWYQIELLVFLNRGGAAASGELWPEDPGAPNPDGAITLLQGGAGGSVYPLVGRAGRRLNPHRYTLDKSGQYESLLHIAWRQPVKGARNAEKLYFEVPGLSGTIRVSRGRYLHADLDILYRTRLPQPQETASVPGAALSAPRFQGYRLHQTRRMRSNELHYIDHPVVGALLIAHPLRSAKKAPKSAADETKTPAAAATSNTQPMAPN